MLFSAANRARSITCVIVQALTRARRFKVARLRGESSKTVNLRGFLADVSLIDISV